MKTSIKTLAFAFAASVALVSCNSVGEQNPQETSKDGPGNVACKGSYTPNFDYYPDLDPVCKSEDREYVIIRDEQEVVFEVDGASYSIKGVSRVSEEMGKCAKGILYNGGYISVTELERIIHNYGVDGGDGGDLKEAMRGEVDAYYERYGICVEAMNSEARDIPIPCELSNHKNSLMWEAMLTEEEIAELKEKYDNISIVPFEFTNDDIPVGGNGGDTPVGGGGGDLPSPCY